MGSANRTIYPLEGLTLLQINALALRFCDGPRPTPFRIVGEKLGVKRAAAHRLITRAVKRIEANGWPVAEAFPGAVRPGKERNNAA